VSLAVLAGWALVRFAFEKSFALPVASLLLLAAGVVALTVAAGIMGSGEVFRRSPLEVLRAE
jgi:ABC-type antimicrobial peptide transport system permease subunit